MELYPNEKQMKDYARQWADDDKWAHRLAWVIWQLPPVMVGVGLGIGLGWLIWA